MASKATAHIASEAAAMKAILMLLVPLGSAVLLCNIMDGADDEWATSSRGEVGIAISGKSWHVW